MARKAGEMETPPAAQGMARKARPAPPWKDGAARRAPKTAEAKAVGAASPPPRRER